MCPDGWTRSSSTSPKNTSRNCLSLKFDLQLPATFHHVWTCEGLFALPS
jgi:hypothetical protein